MDMNGNDQTGTGHARRWTHFRARPSGGGRPLRSHLPSQVDQIPDSVEKKNRISTSLTQLVPGKHERADVVSSFCEEWLPKLANWQAPGPGLGSHS